MIGSNRYNQRLGQRRADAVRDFLVKYGANASQITTASFGETQPKVNSRSKEARFMNRRVFMTVTDGQGTRLSIAAASASTLKMLEDLLAAQQKCCDDILQASRQTGRDRRLASEDDGRTTTRCKKDLARSPQGA